MPGFEFEENDRVLFTPPGHFFWLIGAQERERCPPAAKLLPAESGGRIFRAANVLASKEAVRGRSPSEWAVFLGFRGQKGAVERKGCLKMWRGFGPVGPRTFLLSAECPLEFDRNISPVNLGAFGIFHSRDQSHSAWGVGFLGKRQLTPRGGCAQNGLHREMGRRNFGSSFARAAHFEDLVLTTTANKWLHGD